MIWKLLLFGHFNLFRLLPCRLAPHACRLSDYPIRPRQRVLRNRQADLLGGFKIDHCLPDHLIRSLKHADWNCQTDLIGCLEIDDEFKLRCLLHR